MWLLGAKKAKGQAPKQSCHALLNETQSFSLKGAWRLHLKAQPLAFLAQSSHILGLQSILIHFFEILSGLGCIDQNVNQETCLYGLTCPPVYVILKTVISFTTRNQPQLFTINSIQGKASASDMFLSISLVGTTYCYLNCLENLEHVSVNCRYLPSIQYTAKKQLVNNVFLGGQAKRAPLVL